MMQGREHRRQKTWKVLWYLGPATMQLTKGHMPWKGGQGTQGAVGPHQPGGVGEVVGRGLGELG